MSKSRGSRDPPCPFLGAPMLETWIRWRSVAGESRIAHSADLASPVNSCYSCTDDVRARGLSLAQSLVSAGAERQCRSMQRGRRAERVALARRQRDKLRGEFIPDPSKRERERERKKFICLVHITNKRLTIKIVQWQATRKGISPSMT